jgi:tetratricopeptide (TPR) repeat protein
MGKSIYVYAICKNEAAFASRWMDSMGEADGVVVLDTGSEDGTPDLLRRLGAEVTERVITPWRFDVARNASLALVPEEADICVCTDLDEVFHPGWRAALEEAWTEGTSQASYRYTWSFTPDGREDVVFWAEKIHSRQGFRWVHPVHEVPEWTGEGTMGEKIMVPGIQLDHHPDETKSRAQYLPLLELAVAEAPWDDRNCHYLGREYCCRGMWREAIETLERHLSLPTATWKEERAASMGYLAQANLALGDKEKARAWLLQEVREAPWLREGWLALAKLDYGEENWEGVLEATGKALAITQRPQTYLSQGEAWGALPWDLHALACWHLGRYREAAEAGERAAELAPGDERLRENLGVYRGRGT